MPRPLLALPIPRGERVLDLLPTLARMLDGDGPALLPVDATRPAAEILDLAGDLAPGEDDPDDPTGLVVATSGSTGRPKGALLPASALRASASATAHRLSLAALSDPARPPGGAEPAGAGWLLALPADHIAGLQVLLRSIAAGTEPTVVPEGPFTAAAFTAAVHRMPPGSRAVSLVPTQLHRILDDAEATAAAATFDAILLGGAAADPRLLERARDLRIVTTYGMSETGGGCVYDGVPLDGVTVTLTGPDPSGSGSEAAADGSAARGRIVLSGTVVARGYRNRPGHQAFTVVDGRRAFATSDLGRFDDGRLRVLGRADDVLVTGGVKISPTEVEAVIARLPMVSQALVTAVADPEWGDRLVALVVAAEAVGLEVAHVAHASEPLVATVQQVCRTLHPAAVPRDVLVVAELPLRGIGKPDRRAAADLVRGHLGVDRRPEPGTEPPPHR